MWTFSKSSNILFARAIVNWRIRWHWRWLTTPAKHTCTNPYTHACVHAYTQSLQIRTNPNEKICQEHLLLKLVSCTCITFQCNQSKTVEHFDTDWPNNKTSNFMVILKLFCRGYKYYLHSIIYPPTAVHKAAVSPVWRELCCSFVSQTCPVLPVTNLCIHHRPPPGLQQKQELWGKMFINILHLLVHVRGHVTLQTVN